MEAIVEATARVLVEEGFAGASTNRIAQRAGVSVGSLYQYFPNKEALIMAVAERQSGITLEYLQRTVSDLAGAPIPTAVRTFLKAMLQAYAVNPPLRRVLVEQVMHLGFEHVREIQRRGRMLVRLYLEQHREEILPKDLDLASFVLVATVDSVIHAVTVERPELLNSQKLEDEMSDFILRYLLGSAGGTRGEGAARLPSGPGPAR